MVIDPLWVAFLILGVMHTLEPCADKAIVTLYATGFSGGRVRHALFITLIFGVGMALTYLAIGVAAAFIGESLIEQVLAPVQILASLITIMLGIYLLLVHKGKEGCPGEHHHRILGRALPASPASALMFGLICGAEPCPLELTAYVWVASAGDALTGFILMLTFVIGTLLGIFPLALIAGGLSGTLKRVFGEKSVSKFAGITLILLGIVLLTLSI